MGTIAEMMLDGTLDEQTGEYIGPGVGYPRTMERGHYNSMDKDNTPEFVGIVLNFLFMRGIEVHEQIDLLRSYATCIIEIGGKRTHRNYICSIIRKDKESWKQFKTWIDSL